MLSKFIISNVALPLVCALLPFLFYIVLILFAKYNRKHPPHDEFMKTLNQLATNAVYTLDKTDATGTTKMHRVIAEVTKQLRANNIKLPDGIDSLIENAAEKAVTELRLEQAKVDNATTSTGQSDPVVPTTLDASNLPADENGVVTVGTAPALDVPSTEEEATEGDKSFNIPVANEADQVQPEDVETIDVPKSEEETPANVVLTVNGIAPDENGNVVLPELKGEK